MDQGSTENNSLVNNFASTVTKPSRMTQNLVTVGAKLWTAERFLVDPWFMDQADLVWKKVGPGQLRRHGGNLTIARMPQKQLWNIWLDVKILVTV